MSSSSFDLFNLPNISKIEKLLNDSSYRESIEISANFNTRLCLERKLRMPFLDPQTGVAQNHSNLFMKKSQRMPGLREGQIYTYPMTNRWRKSKRQYLTKMQYSRPFSNFKYRPDTTTHSPIPIVAATAHPSLPNPSGPVPSLAAIDGEQSDFQALIDESNSLGADTDSKDSQNLKDELPKDWYYDEAEINEVEKDDLSEQGDSDFDYNINGYKRKRKRPTKSTRKSKAADSLPYNSDNSRKVRSLVSPSLLSFPYFSISLLSCLSFLLFYKLFLLLSLLIFLPIISLFSFSINFYTYYSLLSCFAFSTSIISYLFFSPLFSPFLNTIVSNLSPFSFISLNLYLYLCLIKILKKFQGRPAGAATGTGRKYNRRKNPSSRNNKAEAADTSNVVEIVNPNEPPSFQSIEQDLNLNLNENSNHEFGSYRKYL